jgi:uncharacterized protein (TIGR03437 family)
MVVLLAVALSIKGFGQTHASLAASGCILPLNGLVGWWSGDTNENDIAGANNPSTVTGVSLVQGEVLKGFSFGTNGYITIPESTSLENQRFTWLAWVRPDGAGPVNDRNGSVIINQLIDNGNFLQLSWSSTSQQFVFVFGGDTTEFVISQHTFAPGKFYLVAGTYDGSAFRLYVNAVLEAALTHPKTVVYSSLGWQFGGNVVNHNPRTWNGVIDEVQAYNRALAQTELQSIYDAGSAGQCKDRPLVSGVLSASAFGGFTSISPGSWIEIYGSNFASTTRSWAASDFIGVNAPTSLDGTNVTIGGKSAFIDYISPGQVNALVPSDTPLGSQQILVKTGDGTSAAYGITVNSVQPGLLAPSSFLIGGKQYAVALFADGSYVLPVGAIPGVTSRPAKPGDTIVVYGVGFGPVIPNIPAGQIVQQSNSLAASLQMSIGGTLATVPYSGLAASFTGLYQLNVVVPSVAGNVPLTFALGGTAGTQTLYLAAQN